MLLLLAVLYLALFDIFLPYHAVVLCTEIDECAIRKARKTKKVLVD